MTEIRNVVIIGSGPAGYTAAIYAARAGLEPLVIAGSVTAGGALMNTTEVENFPGFVSGVQGPELMESLQAQAERFGAEVVFDDAVKLDLTGTVKTVVTGLDKTYQARAVILAMGSAYRELGIPGEKPLSGRGVSWCATCDGFFFRDQEVVVVGGGDSAVEEATFLTRFAAKVTIVHRRDQLRASKIMQDRALNDPKIEFAWNSEVVEAVGADRLTGVKIRNNVTGVESLLPATGMFVAIGHDPRSELVRDVVETSPTGYVLVEGRTSHTNVPGVFACGDLVDDRYRQAITAAGSGCAAALDAQHYLDSLTSTDAVNEGSPTVAATEVPLGPIDVDTADFGAQVLESDLPVLVDFWAPWCGPCRALGPIIAEVANEYAGKVKVVKVNTDNNQELAMTYQITSIPTMILFKNGTLVQSIVGARPKPELVKIVDELIAG